MAEHADDPHGGVNGSSTAESGHGHGEIHLPPNSIIPVCLAVSLCLTFVGFLISPAVWGVGLLLVVICLASWGWAARREYRELPE